MSFTGNEDHSITLADAAEMTARFRDNMPWDDTIAEFFGKSTLLDILNQEDCVGIRFYYGFDDQMRPSLIAVGAKANQDDMVNGVLAQHTKKCPVYCSTANDLNS
jgi:hypothetical protein